MYVDHCLTSAPERDRYMRPGQQGDLMAQMNAMIEICSNMMDEVNMHYQRETPQGLISPEANADRLRGAR